MSDPSSPPQWTSDYFRDAATGSPSGRGLVGHVPVIAVLLIVQGTLELLFGLLCIGFFALVMLVPNEDLRNMHGLGVFAAVLGVPLTTFKRHWRAARVRLMTRLGGELPF